jgi:hypothetical protein
MPGNEGERVSTASGHVTLILDPHQLGDMEIVAPCNVCVLGSVMDPDHRAGKYLCTYQVVECPLCGRTSYKTRPKVRRTGTRFVAPNFQP